MASLLAGLGGYGGGGFNVYPSPTSGQGAFGKVPGATGLPPSNYQQALSSVPGLGQNAATASSDVQSLLQGQVAPDTSDYIKRLVATQGVATGVPGSGLNTADLVKSLGLTSEQLMTSGLGAYNSLLNTVGGLQESPGLMSEIAQQNAALGAAPDPTQVHAQMLRDLENMYGFTNTNPAGGTGGTHILGPRPSFGDTGPTPWWQMANPGDTNTAVATGSPGGAGPGGGPTDTSAGSNAWQDYLKATFGTGNPQFGGASSTYDTTDPTSGIYMGPNYPGGINPANPMDQFTQDYLQGGMSTNEWDALLPGGGG